MKVVKKKIEDGKYQLDCIADAQDVTRALHEAGVEFANSIGAKPKKQGESPNTAIEEKLGIKDADSLLRARAIELLVPIALNKLNIIPLFPPSPLTTSDLKRGKDFAFSIRVTEKPNYELSSYDPVEITVQPKKYDYSQIDEQFKQMAEQYSNFVTAEPKPIEAGDTALISIFATKNGEPLTGLNTESRPYTAGQGYMPEGFEKEILGMEPGETKEFSFEAPDFDDDFNEITVTVDCKVSILEIQTQEASEINDEWVQKNFPIFSSVDDMRAAMQKQIEAEQDKQYEYYLRGMAVNALADRFKGKIEDGAYEAAAKAMKEKLTETAKQNNLTWDQFVEMNGGEQQMNMLMMLETRQELVRGFSLDAIFRKKKLVVAEEDIKDACLSLGGNERNYKQTQKYFEESGRDFILREAAERARAARYLVEHAVITVREPEAPKEEA